MRFVEAFDSTRLTPDAPQSARFEAEAFALVSLLFGEPIVVPDSYALDSHGLIMLASTVVDASAALPSHDRLHWPFISGRRQPDLSHRENLASLVENPAFVLSAWPQLGTDDPGGDPRARNEFAAAIRDHHGMGRRLRALTGDQSLGEQIDRFERLTSYFDRAVPASQVMRTSSKSLEFAVALAVDPQRTASVLLEATDTELEGIESTRRGLEAMQRAIPRLSDGAVTQSTVFMTRSHAHRYKLRVLEEGAPSEAEYDAALEFLDTAYNMVVADSLGSHTRHFAAPNIDSHPLRKGADVLARAIYHGANAPNTETETLELSLDPSEARWNWLDWPKVYDAILGSSEFRRSLLDTNWSGAHGPLARTHVEAIARSFRGRPHQGLITKLGLIGTIGAGLVDLMSGGTLGSAVGTAAASTALPAATGRLLMWRTASAIETDLLRLTGHP
jgi:hypothetical protein